MSEEISPPEEPQKPKNKGGRPLGSRNRVKRTAVRRSAEALERARYTPLQAMLMLLEHSVGLYEATTAKIFKDGKLAEHYEKWLPEWRERKADLLEVSLAATPYCHSRLAPTEFRPDQNAVPRVVYMPTPVANLEEWKERYKHLMIDVIPGQPAPGEKH